MRVGDFMRERKARRSSGSRSFSKILTRPSVPRTIRPDATRSYTSTTEAPGRKATGEDSVVSGDTGHAGLRGEVGGGFACTTAIRTSRYGTAHAERECP